MSQYKPVDTILLHTFRVVVDKGSLSAAAHHLNCVQSNVSTRLKRLEDRLGERMLERGRGGAKVTPFGAIAYEKISQLLDELSALERDLIEISKGGGGSLRLGAMETTAATRLPVLLTELRRKCPKTAISLKTGPSSFLTDLVWKHDLDAAFVAGPIDKDRFKGTCAFKEELVALWVQPDNSKWQGLRTLPKHDVPLLAFPEGCSYRAKAEAWLKATEYSDRSVTEMGSLDAMIGCVAAGMGMSVVPRTAVDRSPDASMLYQYMLPKEFGDVETHLIWRYDRNPSQSLDYLVALLK